VNKTKKIVALIIIIGGLLTLCYDDLLNDYFYKNFEETVIKEKEVLKCNSDIPEGYYDVEVLKGNVSIGLNLMVEGELFHNYLIRKDSNFFIDHGKGKVKISLPERKMLQGDFLVKDYGNYIVGTDILEGTYKITLKTEKNKINKLFVDIYDEKDDEKNSYSFKTQNDNVVIDLKNNQRVSISRPLFDEYKENTSKGFVLEFVLLKQ